MDNTALLRFLSGTSAAAERAEVERWLDSDPARRTEIEQLGRLWQLSATQREPAWDTHALWQRIEREIDGADHVVPDGGRPRLALVPDSTSPAPVPTPSRSVAEPPVATTVTLRRFRRDRRRQALRAAAAIALVAGGAGVWWFTSEAGERGSDAPMRTFTTRRAERLDVTLADGSRVVLGSAGSLRVPESYGRRSRDVYLDGEAYFEVAHRADRPFRVHTARSVSEDLGTRFVVTAFSDDSADIVAVAEGVVGVRAATSESVVLAQRDVARVSADGAVSTQRDVDVGRYFSWLDDVLVFEDALLAEAIPVLERRYAIDIHLADSALAQRRFTGSFRAPLEESLSALATVLGATYQRTDRVVTLRPTDPSRR